MIIMLRCWFFRKNADVRGRGSENSDACGQEGRGGVKMGKNLRTSFMDGPLTTLLFPNSRYISDCIKDLISCFESDDDQHVELAMLYKQHLDKYLHFSKSCLLLSKFITCHTTRWFVYKQHLDKYLHFSKSCLLFSKFITCHTTRWLLFKGTWYQVDHNQSETREHVTKLITIGEKHGETVAT